MVKYKRVAEQGYTFLFKYDSVDPSLLHIYARHLTTIDDALDVFFDTVPTWNPDRQRFEDYSDTHGLYWFWLDERNREVMVVTCFRL